jgi:hypothetical protein
MASDTNLMFRIYKEGDTGKLWIKGTGEFTGDVIASTFKNKVGSGEEESLYLSTTPKELTVNS